MFRLLKAEIGYRFQSIIIFIICIIIINYLTWSLYDITTFRLIFLFVWTTSYINMSNKEKRISMLSILPIKPIKIALLRFLIPTFFIIVFLVTDVISRIIFWLFYLKDDESIWIFIVIIYIFISGQSIVVDEPKITKNQILSDILTILAITIFIVGGFLIGLSMGLTGIITSILIIDTTLIVTSIFTFTNRRSFLK
ncbi:MAG: hypothetical protein ABSG15_10980 [FCB group bacterium]